MAGTDPLSGEVLSKGSPAGTRTGACWTSTLRGTQVTHGMPQMAFPGAEASQGNGRDEKSPDGRSSDRITTSTKTRFGDRPSSPATQWPDAENEGVAGGGRREPS